MQEIKVARCVDCPFFKPFENNHVIDGVCTAIIAWIDIYNEGEIHSDCPIKGETITFKIGDNE